MVKKGTLYKFVKTWNELQIPKLNLFELIRSNVKNFISKKSHHLERGYLLKLSIAS